MSGPEKALEPLKVGHRDLPREEDLIHQIANGDSQALDELYHQYGKMILAHALFITSELSISEEVLQDTMLAVWRGAASFRGDASVRSWVISIARRQARDRIRRHRLKVVDDTNLLVQPSNDPSPELVALERADVKEVAEAIQLLSSSHKEVIGLIFGTGLSLSEVANVLEIPVGTVKSRLFSARIALAGALSKKGVEL
ncbi:MAG: sigma-70 family RNA polymerase sigma factor [Actinomycetota bacterium]|nr:sigma-70 family RNA polymerase sigma factor [Actinomycetota bacterium]